MGCNSNSVTSISPISSPSPNPSPNPTPSPIIFTWIQSGSDDGCRRIAPDGNYHLEIDSALVRSTIRFPWAGSEKYMYSILAPIIRADGFDVAMYGEELAIQKAEGYSENYDLFTSEGNQRLGSGAYRSTCQPAIRSEGL